MEVRPLALSRHAEQMALANVPVKLKERRNRRGKYKMIIIRRMENGELGNSMPCTHCLQRCIAFGVSKIGYVTDGVCHFVRPQELIGKTTYSSAEKRLRELR